MKTLLIFSPKGGSGKTTLARHMAAAAAHSGLIVAALDTDPQGTLTHWLTRRPAAAPKIIGHKILLGDVAGAPINDPAIDLLVIDTPTMVEAFPAAMTALIDAADFILMPTRAAAEDILSVNAAMGMLTKRRRPAAFVLSGVKPRQSETEQARLMLAGVGEVAPPAIPDLAEISRSFIGGQSIADLPTAKSAEVFAALWRFTAAKLGFNAAGADHGA